jgi:hypothetical protein
MDRAVNGRRGVVTGAVIAFALAAVAAVAWYSRVHTPATTTFAAAVAPEGHRPPGARDEPHREFTADRQLARIQHKDGSGLSPLDLVTTPQGLVTVQRTFGTDGALLEEKAFLDGSPVPVPR